MLGSEVIDVGVGVVLLFLFMSLIATSLREIIENFQKSRARDLERGIAELLSASGQQDISVKAFYEHPIISALYKDNYKNAGRNLPSYIPRQSFSLALLDLMAKASEKGSPLTVDRLRTELEKAPTPNAVQRVVLMALGTGERSLGEVRTAVEEWYDGTMDRIAGWYARRTGRFLAAIGFFAAMVFNVDAITISQHLVRDKALRQAVVSEAAKVTGPADASGAKPPPPAAPLKRLGDLVQELDGIGVPMGWQVQDGFVYPKPQTCIFTGSAQGQSPVVCSGGSGWLVALVGWMITALAIMLGAPFWFDVLNKFMIVRSTIKPKEKSPDEASADAKPSTPAHASAVTKPTGPEGQSASSGVIVSAGAAATAALAAGHGAFLPHEWAVGANPQAGVI